MSRQYREVEKLFKVAPLTKVAHHIAILSKPHISIPGGKWLFVFNMLSLLTGVLRNWWWLPFPKSNQKAGKMAILGFSKPRMNNIVILLHARIWSAHTCQSCYLSCCVLPMLIISVVVKCLCFKPLYKENQNQNLICAIIFFVIFLI